MTSIVTSARPSGAWGKTTYILDPQSIRTCTHHSIHMHTHTEPALQPVTTVTSSFTFQAADPPKAGVGERPRVFLVLVVGILLG